MRTGGWCSYIRGADQDLGRAAASCGGSESGSVEFELMLWQEPGKKHHHDQTLTNHLNKGYLSSCPLSRSVLWSVLGMECCSNPMVFLSAASVGHRNHTLEAGRRAVVRGP